ncbi:MAG TPA: TIGR02996 domain-containing protein, partial [Kofleriaceae bacterium]
MRLENGTEFVEIERVGRHLSIRRGRIGTRGETREKRSGDFDSNLLGFLRKGFTRMPGEIPPEVFAVREPALEQALREHRDDPDAYAIYADWLQANGNPAGELIAVAREREAKADIAPKLQKRYDALVSRLRMPLPDAATLHWRHGMWQTLRLENKHDF